MKRDQSHANADERHTRLNGMIGKSSFKVNDDLYLCARVYAQANVREGDGLPANSRVDAN
jgi:hypothetical protein